MFSNSAKRQRRLQGRQRQLTGTLFAYFEAGVFGLGAAKTTLSSKMAG
ncbi:hypothetical protein RISK_002807 [Rhodopirellula islandica]|uniref:Uncharacterized protein n=1 Tax=Rhodopirellula islandica TaxID=595434 RepID=A0A0J1BEU5_RHOIS|nr:hypothetical protein [Rhodopirellula islandica]KLU05045.1 hypothetical protein RISK_002807 [Rhodopirellula islandica]